MATFQGLLDLFFPPSCLGCGTLLDETSDFCSDCAWTVERLAERPACPTCAEPRPDVSGCDRCRALPPPFSRAFSAFESLNLFALATVGGAFHWYGAVIAGLLLRALPALLTDLGIDGYVTIGIFGVALFHALATAPSGIAGQIAALLARFTRGGER